MDDRFGVNPHYLAGVFALEEPYQHAHKEGKGKGKEGRKGGGMMEIWSWWTKKACAGGRTDA